MNKSEKEKYKEYLRQQRETSRMKMIKSQTGSGKTENIGKLLKSLVLGSCIIAVPTNDLKKEEFKRLKDMGVKDIKMTPELAKLKDSDMEETQKYYRDIGVWNKRKSYLQEQRERLQQKEKTTELTDDEKEDLYNIDHYLTENEEINHYFGHIVTTHERALNLHYELVTTHSLIIDEDILTKTCIKTPTFKLRYIENTFDVASEVLTGKNKEYLTQKLEKIQNAPLDMIIPVPLFDIVYLTEEQRENLEEHIAETDKYIYNIYDLMRCSAIYKYKDPKENEIKVQCLICRRPPKMHTTILSATIDEEIYRKFFSEYDIEFVELPKAKYKGKIVQDCTITYSRKSLAKGKDKDETDENYKNGISPILDIIREKHKGLPLITFKKYCKKRRISFWSY